MHAPAPALLLAVIAALSLAHARGLTVDDMIKLHRLGDPVLSPDGEHYVYTETEYLEGKDSSYGYLVYSSINTPDMHQRICESVAPSKRNPTFLDKDTLIFTGISENQTNQAWYVKLNDLETCHQITSFPISIDNIMISTAGSSNHILFSAEVYYGMTMEETSKKEVERENGPKYSLFTDGYVRHWDTWFEQDKWVHLFSTTFTIDSDGVIEVKDEEVVDITSTVKGDVPMRPFGDRSQISISPDGTKVAYVTQDTNSDNNPFVDNPSSRQWTTNDSIFIVDIDGTTDPTCITCNPEEYFCSGARAASPKWASDYVLYFLGMRESESESDRVRLVKYEFPESNTATGTPSFTFLTGDYDFSISSFEIDPDEEDIFWLVVSQRARSRIVKFNANAEGPRVDSYNPKSTERYTIVTENGSASSPQLTKDGRIIFGYNSYTAPSDVYILNESEIAIDSFPTISRLSKAKDGISSEICLQEPLEFDYGEEGNQVQSFYFLPCGFNPDDEENKKPPLILYVHGGPESPWSDAWSYRWNPQAILAEGYSMVLTNFHGSDSFGEKFTKSIRQNWYDDPFNDVVNGLKWMIEHGYGDPERVGAMGASYGGTFMNWLNGHNYPLLESWTDSNGNVYPDIRVKVIVTHDGIFDLRSFGYDTEETFFPAREFNGFPEDSFSTQFYEADNPANHSHKWRTPTLVIQGGCDYRIAPNHGISAFQTLRMQGVDAQLLYFPTQSHWVYSPQESVVWHNTVLSWLGSYLKDEKN